MRMTSPRSSICIDQLSATIAAFQALYIQRKGAGKSAASEVMLMTTPAPRVRMCGKQLRTMRMRPKTST